MPKGTSWVAHGMACEGGPGRSKPGATGEEQPARPRKHAWSVAGWDCMNLAGLHSPQRAVRLAAVVSGSAAQPQASPDYNPCNYLSVTVQPNMYKMARHLVASCLATRPPRTHTAPPPPSALLPCLPRVLRATCSRRHVTSSTRPPARTRATPTWWATWPRRGWPSCSSSTRRRCHSGCGEEDGWGCTRTRREGCDRSCVRRGA